VDGRQAGRIQSQREALAVRSGSAELVDGRARTTNVDANPITSNPMA